MEIRIDRLNGPCPCGESHTVSLRDVVLERGALERLPGLLAQPAYESWHTLAAVCDENTFEAAGRRVCALLPAARPVVLPAANLHADEHGVSLLLEALPARCDAMLAVGSGTIHDITRFVGKEKGLPFLSVPTAASVDGFVSSVAAMTWGGYKRTFPSVPPVAVAADTSVIAAAPARLTRSGFGDLLGKYIALADWKIAHCVTGEPFCERICALEEQALEEAVRLAGSSMDERFCEQLMAGLLLSGIAMQMMGNSRPASGAEHHCSHLWEMEVISPHLDALHGEKVGVGTLLAARAYHGAERRLREGSFAVPPYEGPEWEDLRRAAGERRLESFLEENTPDPLASVPENTLRERAGEMAALLREIPSEERLEGLLASVGAKRSLGDIGLNEALREPTLRFAPYVRRRLTFLRLMKRFRFP